MRRFFVLCCASLLLAGCGAPGAPSVRLALDGPPLAVAARNGAASWLGAMDRGCMAGLGTMFLRNPDGTTCTGEIDHPASDKGRLHIDLTCTNGDAISIVYRNLGPDQGMGIGRFNPEQENGERITLFYHPSLDEARRRLERTMADIAGALEQKRKKDAAEEAVSAE